MVIKPNKQKSAEYNALNLEEQLAGEVVALLDEAEKHGHDRSETAKEIVLIARAFQTDGPYTGTSISVSLKQALARIISAGWLPGDAFNSLVNAAQMIAIGEPGTEPLE